MSVALRCNPLCRVALRSVAIRCVVSVLLHCVALCCDPLSRCCVVSVELRCALIRCVVLRCVAIRCVALPLCFVALLTTSAFLVFCLP